jgi:hypothetical protein
VDVTTHALPNIGCQTFGCQSFSADKAYKVKLKLQMKAGEHMQVQQEGVLMDSAPTSCPSSPITFCASPTPPWLASLQVVVVIESKLFYMYLGIGLSICT